MAHELKPRTGHLPSPAEVVRILANEFAFVKSDEDDGIKQARARAEWIEKAPARVFLGHHQQALENALKLKNLVPGEALTVEFGDSKDRTKRIFLIPGEPINFGYSSKDDEEASREVVERCAAALNCDVVLI
jgi:hypothetical protein